MDDYKKCSTCGEWGWFDRPSMNHVCAPKWEARIYETKWQEDWCEVHAHDAERAAAKFCETYDQNGDYDIIQRGSAEIEVRKFGDAKVSLVDVSAESVPQYYGHVRAGKAA